MDYNKYPVWTEDVQPFRKDTSVYKLVQTGRFVRLCWFKDKMPHDAFKTTFHIVQYDYDIYGDTQFDDIIEWMLENTTHLFRLDNDFRQMYFEDENEAILFKLRFG